jgi:hypothetical protein
MNAREVDREMISALQARCAMLKGLLTACASHLPPEWGLTHTEERLVGALINGSALTRSQLVEELYYDRTEPATAETIVAQLVMTIRRKLAPHGVRIRMVHGMYSLDPPAKQIVVRRLEAGEAIKRAMSL